MDFVEINQACLRECNLVQIQRKLKGSFISGFNILCFLHFTHTHSEVPTPRTSCTALFHSYELGCVLDAARFIINTHWLRNDCV